MQLSAWKRLLWIVPLCLSVFIWVATPRVALAGITPTPTPTITPTPGPGTPSATPVSSSVTTSDPVIRKVANTNVAQVGEVIEYTIEASNPGGSDTGAVNVVDVLPAEVDFVGVSTSQGSCAYDAAQHTVNCAVGVLGPGGGATISLRVRVNARAQAPNAFSNAATLFIGTTPLVGSQSASVQVIPGLAPEAGQAPGPASWLTWLLAALAFVSPFIARRLWKAR